MAWREIVALPLANAALIFTVTETKLFRPFRDWLKAKNDTLGELAGCGYCFGHWSAFAVAAIYQPRIFHAWWPLGYFLTAVVIAWLSAFQWIALCWLMQKTVK
jgi:hypothetical protein